MTIPADIELINRLVVDAGRRAKARCGTVDCELKADDSLVTVVDRETEQFLYAELQREYPGFAFVGEEYGWRGERGVPLWACDPIDGTTNFVHGLPMWGVSLGLLVDAEPILGAIYLPVTDELFWGVRGEGSFANGIRLAVEDRDAMGIEDTVCLTSNSLKTLNPEAIPGRIRAFGSIAAELAYTARGNLTATVGLHEGVVDMAAAFVICSEAGCEVRHLSNEPFDVGELLRAGRTTRHFMVGPPRFLDYLSGTLRLRP